MGNAVKYQDGLKAAFKGGLIAGGLNLIWLFALDFILGIEGLPKGFPIAVLFSSVLPGLLGALLFVLLVRNFQKGFFLFLLLASAFTFFSLFPSFQSTLPDGTAAPEQFALLTVPMHFIASVGNIYPLYKLLQ